MSNVILIALLIGGTLSILNFFLFAGGHGIYLVSVVCFGPTFALGHISENYLIPLISGPLLYPLYAIIIANGRRFRKPLTAMWGVLIFHNLFVAFFFNKFWTYERNILQKLNEFSGDYMVYLSIGIYLLANILAIVYSMRREKLP